MKIHQELEAAPEGVVALFRVRKDYPFSLDRFNRQELEEHPELNSGIVLRMFMHSTRMDRETAIDYIEHHAKEVEELYRRLCHPTMKEQYMALAKRVVKVRRVRTGPSRTPGAHRPLGSRQPNGSRNAAQAAQEALRNFDSSRSATGQ